MNPEELQIKIDELEDKISSMQKEKITMTGKFESRIAELERLMLEHNHTGFDGTGTITSTLELSPSETVKIGNFEMVELTKQNVNPYGEEINGFLLVGKDEQADDGIYNSQVTIQHQEYTNNSTNQTFMFGYRGPLFQGGDATISSGGTTMNTKEQIFQTNELDGAYLLVEDPTDTSSYEVFEIASNTRNDITITGGTWGFNTTGNALWFVFVPIYLGSANYPWRRVYTGLGSPGGVRFGFGDTDGGQNGLLYMNSSGSLVWRDLNSNETTIVTGA